MRSIDFEPRRFDGLLARLRNRNSLLVIVGALAIAAIVLSQLLRSGPATPEAKPAQTIPTIVPAAATAVPVVVTVRPAPTVAPTAIAERVHTVASGDTLSSIAQKYYGDATKSAKIYEANKDILKDPNTLSVGQKLKIPD